MAQFNLMACCHRGHVASFAGKIAEEQAARGIAIAFEDLVIDATALDLGFDVATFNVKRFKLIPSLNLVTLCFSNVLPLAALENTSGGSEVQSRQGYR